MNICPKLEAVNNAVMVSHVFATGPTQDLEEFLRDYLKIRALLFIGHPLFYQKGRKGSGYRYYENGSLIKEIDDFKFLIIGTGNYETVLKQRVSELNLDFFVEFTGFIEDHREIEKLLAKSACAVALYNKEIDPWTYYTDHGKVKAYLAASLPVILTDVPQIARQIEEHECGVVIEYKKNDLVKAIISLIKDEGLNKKYRKNAIDFAKQFDWNIIFKRRLERIL